MDSRIPSKLLSTKLATIFVAQRKTTKAAKYTIEKTHITLKYYKLLFNPSYFLFYTSSLGYRGLLYIVYQVDALSISLWKTR